jgi:hypothetical protein
LRGAYEVRTGNEAPEVRIPALENICSIWGINVDNIKTSYGLTEGGSQ